MQLIQSMNNERTDTALSSICDDLSFSMYVEESTVETIRELEQKKTKAVNGNDFFFSFMCFVIQINHHFPYVYQTTLIDL